MGEPISTVGQLAGVCGHDGTSWLKALVDSAGHLQIDVIASGLPAGGATAANQATMITALQLIDDLRNALDSVGTDELNIIVAGQDADVEVTQTTPADLTVAQHQYDGSDWRKSNLLWGYNDRYAERVREDDAAAGGNALSTTAVPAGYVYVVQVISFFNTNNACNFIRVSLTDGSTYVTLVDQQTPAANVVDVWTGEIVLKEGDYVYAWFDTCILNDQITLDVWGYKMKINM